MALPGVLLFSHYVENFWSSPPPLVDWSGLGIPTLVLVLTALAIAVTALMARPDGKATRLPGPPALPFLGTRWLFWSRYKMNKLHEAYEDMFRRYGPVFVETMPGGAAVVSIAQREALEAVLRIPAKRPYRPPTEIVQVYRRSRPDRYASTGLVNEQGEKWYHLRHHLTADLTSPHTMQNFLPELNSICDDFLSLLQSCCKPDGTVHGFDQLTNRMGLESVCGLMLGSRLGFLERCMSGRVATLAVAVKTHFRAQRDSYYGAPLWKFVPTQLYRTFVKSEETIHTIVSDLMEEAKSRTSGTSQDDGMQEIFLKILENPALDMRDKKAAIIDFITAGIETLANSLVFLLYLLSGRPDWQQKIRSELPVCGILKAEEMAAAPAVRAATNEAFRLLPTAPFLARLLEAPMNISGHKLPAGTFVLAHTGAACRREENFWRAQEYLPERWLESRQPHAAALVAPFGRGRRMCPGKRFVELELHLLLAKIMQRWRVEFDGELDIQFDFLLSPKSPVSLRLVEW
ncbi:ecdysone 20-monooxygenase isoform X1 [Plodia interpunctella]|uniref:ecdysone 20-monooxygenase isoform X1 n=2 Tax=Plodia interpunctella TaxID=58824 RepID=UPI002367BB45|nr:ecdysone 20-monooxygenase isoform X1 [Plodia interpunctella]